MSGTQFNPSTIRAIIAVFRTLEAADPPPVNANTNEGPSVFLMGSYDHLEAEYVEVLGTDVGTIRRGASTGAQGSEEFVDITIEVGTLVAGQEGVEALERLDVLVGWVASQFRNARGVFEPPSKELLPEAQRQGGIQSIQLDTFRSDVGYEARAALVIRIYTRNS